MNEVITDENVLGDYIANEPRADSSTTVSHNTGTDTAPTKEQGTSVKKAIEQNIEPVQPKSKTPILREVQRDLDDTANSTGAEHIVRTDNLVRKYDQNRLDNAWNNFKQQNLSKETAQYALNNMDYNNTLALSRFADAFNNRYWTTPVGIGARYHSRNGSSGTDLSNVVAQSRAHRKEPIVTEETRQMEATRALDKKRREQEQDHYNTLRTFETELLKHNANTQIDFLTFLSKMDAETQQYIMKAYTDFEYTMKNKASLDQLLYKNKIYMDAALKAEVADLINKVSRNNPIYGQILGQQFNTVTPSQLQRITQDMITDIIEESNGNAEAALGAIIHLLNYTSNTVFNTFFKDNKTDEKEDKSK